MELRSIQALSEPVSVRSRDGWHSCLSQFPVVLIAISACLLPSAAARQLRAWLASMLYPGLIWGNDGEMCCAGTECGDTAKLNALLSLMNYGRTLCSLRDILLSFLMLV